MNRIALTSWINWSDDFLYAEGVVYFGRRLLMVGWFALCWAWFLSPLDHWNSRKWIMCRDRDMNPWPLCLHHRHQPHPTQLSTRLKPEAQESSRHYTWTPSCTPQGSGRTRNNHLATRTLWETLQSQVSEEPATNVNHIFVFDPRVYSIILYCLYSMSTFQDSFGWSHYMYISPWQRSSTVCISVVSVTPTKCVLRRRTSSSLLPTQHLTKVSRNKGGHPHHWLTLCFVLHVYRCRV